jgi:hypothetical protein
MNRNDDRIIAAAPTAGAMALRFIRMAPRRHGSRRPSGRPPRVDKVTYQRGIESEMRVLESCRLPSRPPWMHRARPATRIEDRSGIDIVIESDVGALLVQVKSSNAGKQYFRRRPLLSIGIVVVRTADSAEALLAKVVGELEPIRAQHLEKGLAVRPRRGRSPPAKA